MTWFLSKIVYQIICGEGDHTPQFDEQLRLVMAMDIEDAVEKSETIGRQEEERFYNHKEQLVQWKYIGVAELTMIDEFVHGAEVHSQIKEVEDAEAYRSFVLHKSNTLVKNGSLHNLQTA